MAAAPPYPGADLTATALRIWIERTIAAAPNDDLLRRRLESIDGGQALMRFLHRFVIFNDALAARVPFLAGIIHLTPDLFLDPASDEAFCRQSNGRIAAYVAEAAKDEYRMTADRSFVHQYLSQLFLRGVLEHFRMDGPQFDRGHALPAALADLLDEARSKFFVERGPTEIFSALGFHVGLEFFAHQEFNLVDGYLKSRHPALVARLKRRSANGSAYQWLATHTVVEIGHYRAGLAALDAAVRHFHRPDQAPLMVAAIKQGFLAFIDLQRRFYEAVDCDAASVGRQAAEGGRGIACP